MIDPKAYILEGNPFQGLTQGIGQGLQLGAAYADKERAIAAAESFHVNIGRPALTLSALIRSNARRSSADAAAGAAIEPAAIADVLLRSKEIVRWRSSVWAAMPTADTDKMKANKKYLIKTSLRQPNHRS